MKPPQGPDAAVRRKTWPLAGFVFGFLLAPPPRPLEEPDPKGVLIVSLGVGFAFCVVACFGVDFFSRNRGPTKSAMPFSDERPGQAVLFTVCFLASCWLKTFGHWGLLGMALGIVPVWIILRGGAKAAGERQSE
jgi:hypothetical protein